MSSNTEVQISAIIAATLQAVNAHGAQNPRTAQFNGVTMPVFEGGENVASWFKTYETRTRGWAENKRNSSLPQFLSGSADARYHDALLIAQQDEDEEREQRRIEEDVTTFAGMRKFLIKEFSRRNGVDFYKKKIEGLKQGSSSIDSYYNELRTLARSVGYAFDAENKRDWLTTNESLMISYFVRGLRRVDVRGYVELKRCKTLSEAVYEAEEYERTHPTNISDLAASSLQRTLPTEEFESRTVSKRWNSQAEVLQKRIEALEGELRKQQKGDSSSSSSRRKRKTERKTALLLSSSEEESESEAAERKTRSTRSSKRAKATAAAVSAMRNEVNEMKDALGDVCAAMHASKPTNGGVCFKCGKTGHYAKECPGTTSANMPRPQAQQQPNRGFATRPRINRANNSKARCTNCGRVNHMFADCRQQGGGNATLCGNCGLWGHNAQRCLRRAPGSNNAPWSSSNDTPLGRRRPTDNGRSGANNQNNMASLEDKIIQAIAKGFAAQQKPLNE
jgi:hypothetical protein